MKKFLSLALVLAMMVSTAALTACGEDSKESSGASSSSNAPSSSNTPANSNDPAQTDNQTGPSTNGSENVNPPVSNNPTQGETVYHAYEEVENLDAWKQDKTNLTEMYYDSMVASHSQFGGFDYRGDDVDETIPEAGTHEFASNLFDGDPETKWCSPSNQVEFYASIVWVMNENVNVTGYTMTTGNDNSGYTDRNPISWRLYGALELPETTMMEEDPNTGFSYLESETIPTGWTLIDAVDASYEDDVYTSQIPDLNFTEVGMNVANPGTYKYFMLLVDYCEGGTFQLGDFTLYGSVA